MTKAVQKKIKELRKKGLSWVNVADAIGHSIYKTRILADNKFIERRREYKRTGIKLIDLGKVQAPNSVLKERNKAFACPPSPNQSILGDPPNGRSALDKK